MTPEQIRIIELQGALAKAIGALSIIQISPKNFNQDGLKRLLTEITDIATRPMTEQAGGEGEN